MSEFNSVEEKISFLHEIEKAITIEIYKLCVRCCIDPDSFDYTSFKVMPNYSQLPFAPKLENLCKQLVDLEKKIEELKSA